jgi:hypothetical protein
MIETVNMPVPKGWRERIGSSPLAMRIALPVLAFALGAGVMAIAVAHRPTAIALTLTPTPVAALHEGSAVALKGQVAEIFGNKFILQDESGRALVETGPEGEGAKLVAPSETVTVQGRFDDGFVHAAAITHADGRNDILGPPGPPPPHRLLSWGGPHGWAARIPWLPRG